MAMSSLLFTYFGGSFGAFQDLLLVLCSGITPYEFGGYYGMPRIESKCKARTLPAVLLFQPNVIIIYLLSQPGF